MLYQSGLSYMTINTARSSISTVFGDIDGRPIGEHPLIVKFCKGVGKLRPPKPKYQVTWDPSIILNLIKEWDSDTVNLKKLSYKTIALLALVSGQRVQTLSKIKICNITFGDSIQIKIHDMLKTSNFKVGNPIIVIPPFHDKNICPVKTLQQAFM
jgi:hypothetical protein